MDLKAPVLDHDRFLDGGMPLRHVVVGQEGCVRLPCGVLDRRGGDEVQDTLRYLALVKGVARAASIPATRPFPLAASSARHMIRSISA